MKTNCLRCAKPCQIGTPDPKARALVRSATAGFCPACMITRFLLEIEPVRDIIEGTPNRPGKGPEVLFGGPCLKILQPVIAGVLAHTQLREDEIDWVEVVGNWGMPWPKGMGPKIGDV